jgi:dimethylamine/trimethylamine dehydrogenase
MTSCLSASTMSPLPPGCHWRRDAVARLHLHPIPTDPAMPIFTPDDLMAGAGPVGGRPSCFTTMTISTWARSWPNFLVARGCTVHFVTPAVKVAEWTDNTLEQATISAALPTLA